MTQFARSFFGALALGALAGPVGGHPHLFIKTHIVLETNEAREVTGVRMSWTFDSFFSLLIFEDMELDRDADGELTEAELDLLMGFDLEDWPPGFEGDLYLYDAQGTKVDMPRPMPTDIAVLNGEIVSSQFREVPRVPAEGLRIQQYDPTYYVAYELAGGIEIDAPCAVRIEEADLGAAEAEMARLAQEQLSEDIFVEVQLGHLYAYTAHVSCGG